MQRLFCIILLYLSVTGIGASIKAATPMTAGLSHLYGIYFSSEEGADLNELYGSFIRFSLKAGVGAVYDFYVKEGQHFTGRIESYNEKESEKEYVLEKFFDNKSNARLRILDMPDCDNIKTAVLYYANEKEDPAGTFHQYILFDEDFGKVSNQIIKN